MYFDKTTDAERSVISAVLYSAVNELRDASAILAEAIYDDLDGDTPRVEWALPRLRLAHSVLETFIDGFALTIGDTADMGAKHRNARLKGARLAVEVDRVHAAIDELPVPKDKRRDLYDRLYEIKEMDDEAALKALDAVKKEVCRNG